MRMAASCGESKYADLTQVLRDECASIGGYGEITLKITFHAGAPQTVDVLDRRRRYRLGQQAIDPMPVSG